MTPLPRSFVAVLAVFACTLSALAGSENLKVLSLEPTVLFPKREPLAQIARLTVANVGAAVTGDVVVTVAGGATETTTGVAFKPNQSTVDVLVPDIAAPASVKIEIRASGTALATYEQTWQPQRKWKVFIVKSSHEDIGYENFIFKKQKEIAEFIDLGREQSSPRSVAGNIGGNRATMKDSSYHYTLESILFQRNYLEERGEKAWREIVDRDLKTGHMALMGAPSGVHSHWMDYEELARMTYPARRETRDRFGLDLKTFMIVDNPSLSWSGGQAVADAGFKYVARWGQPWRSGGNNDYATTKVPAIFWWQGPNGSSRVLYSWRSHYAMGFWYGQTGSYRDQVGLATGFVSDLLKQVEGGSLGPYPYDALVTPEYVDHDIPRFDLRVLPNWKERYAFPDLQTASPEAFFTYIEKKYGDSLPVLSGDLNNFSADYSSIDPVSQDWKRQAARLLPAAEGLGVLAGFGDPGFALLPSLVERSYTRLFDYDEHCWPTLPRATDEQLFNANWVKKQEAKRALDAAESLFQQAATAWGPQIASAGEGTFAVFNPLAHPRTDLVEWAGNASAVTDLRTGKVIACEPAGPGRVTFLATDVPAFGYTLFRVTKDKPASAPTELKAEPLSIANQFYTVRFHAETGAVTSIVEKASGRELVDASAPYGVNQLVYVHKNEREAKEGFDYTPKKVVKLAPRLGRDRVDFDVWIDDAKLGGRMHQTVTLHAGVKRVDFVNRLESIDVMHSMTYEDRYRDNLFFAFPFAVPHGQIRAEYAGGVVRPYDDQLRWGSHDYLSANRWIDVSNATGGVTLVAREASTYSLGEIRYNQFGIDYKPTKPWLFSYAWSNRMAGLLSLEADDCNATFTYSMTSHDGDWNSGAAVQHGWRTASPLLTFPVSGGATAKWQGKQQSFLSLSAPNVQLTVLKDSGVAGRGWVARLVETDGKATEVELDASVFGVSEAMLCNLVEDDSEPLTVRDGRVRVPVKPFSFTTVRLIAGKAPGAVTGLQASDVTDAAARVRWAPVAGSAAYQIYRSDDPASPATAYNLVARTTKPELVDSGLNLATTYYYRVAAVSATNQQGPLSPLFEVKTTSVNRTAPSAVHELGVIRAAPTTVIVYWRKNPEPDVARYRVFRSEKPDFSLEGQTPVAVLEANTYFLQTFRDAGLQGGKTYYYRVQPVDWADNVQPASPVAGATTPKDRS